jgi:DNA-binding transcriptional LysR family regulator
MIWSIPGKAKTRSRSPAMYSAGTVTCTPDTEVGQSFYERCRAMLLEAEQAEAVVAEALTEPHGRIRFSCPTGMVEVIAAIVPPFLTRYPKVRLQILASDRSVDLIEERIDVALRVRSALTSDAALTMRTLGHSRRILVASPQMAGQVRSDIAALSELPTLSTSDDAGEIEWHLEREDGVRQIVRHEPRMSCGDFAAVRVAAAAGLGIALLPDHVCGEALGNGQLVHARIGAASRASFTSSSRPGGLPPAVRALIDHLAVHASKGDLSSQNR